MVDKSKFAEQEAAFGYTINIHGRNVYFTEAMKNYSFEKLNKIERFHNHIMDIHVIMDIQKVEHSVEIIVKFDHLKVKVSACSTDMYASIDRAVDKMRAQLRRWKGKIQDHHRKKLSIVDMQVNVLERPYDDVTEINDAIESARLESEVLEFKPHKIIGTEKKPLKMLTTDEAIMKMELSGDRFLVFKGQEDQKIRVIYRRTDGNYGLILTA